MKYALRACEIFAPSGQMFRCAVGHGTFLWGCATEMNLWRAAVAASAPSEEGAGAPKGFRGATEGIFVRITVALQSAVSAPLIYKGSCHAQRIYRRD